MGKRGPKPTWAEDANREPVVGLIIRSDGRYSAIVGVKFSPHTLRHTFAHRFLGSTSNDIVALAQLLGHENLNTTAIYTKRSQDELQQRVDELRYE